MASAVAFLSDPGASGMAPWTACTAASTFAIRESNCPTIDRPFSTPVKTLPQLMCITLLQWLRGHRRMLLVPLAEQFTNRAERRDPSHGERRQQHDLEPLCERVHIEQVR